MAEASSSTTPPEKPISSSSTIQTVQPISNTVLRNALLTLLSPEEYKRVHQHLIKRAPASLQRKAIDPKKYETLVRPTRGDGSNVAALRVSLRLFAGANVALKVVELLTTKLAARKGKGTSRPAPRTSYFKSSRFRSAGSISLVLLLHRLLFRFLQRLRANLLIPDAEPFRRRNPRLSRALTSQYAPAIGASFAATAMGLFPDQELRVYMAVLATVTTGEFVYNAADAEGLMKKVKPWWVGSWMFFPVACSELLYAFVFQRDAFPKEIGDFILKHTPNYIQRRPADFPKDRPWPHTYEIVDSLAEISKLRWPAFISPILHPSNPNTLPPTLTQIAPITGRAHPLLEQNHSPLSCALLHPNTPSCLLASMNHTIQSFTSIIRFIALIYGAFSLPKYKSFLKDPLLFLNKFSKNVLRTSTMLTTSIATAWGSICLFNQIFPRSFLPTQRWLLSGFLAGIWGFVDRSGGRAQFLYSLRAMMVSTFKLGKIRGWWKGGKGGDVVVFVVALAVMNVLYEKRREAINQKPFQVMVRLLQGPTMQLGGKGKGKERRESREEENLGESAVLVE